jgi:hypothetical protein
MTESAASTLDGPARGDTTLRFSLSVPAIVPLLLAGLALRLWIATIDGFGVDIGTFQAWAARMADGGPWDFYADDFFTDYAPGYMYVLWLIGELHQALGFTEAQFEYVLKLPSIVADLASATLLWVMLKDRKPAVRIGVTAVYLFLPITLFIGALWGQVDSVLAFFLLLSVYYIGQDRPVAGAVAYTVGFLVKPQAIAALPFLAFWIIREHPPRWERNEDGSRHLHLPPELIYSAVVPLAVLLVMITPFFLHEPWRLIGELNDATQTCNYRVNSFWAYNFWTMGGLFEWGFRPDTVDVCEGASSDGATYFGGIATMWWGRMMLVAALGMIIVSLRKARGTGFLALGTALSMMAFYLFLTRMHERYVFPAFLPLLLACALLQSRVLWGLFVATVTVHFLNLYHVFGYYYFFDPEQAGNFPAEIRWRSLMDWLQESDALGVSLPVLGTLEAVQVLSMIFVAGFAALLATGYVLSERSERAPPVVDGA